MGNKCSLVTRQDQILRQKVVETDLKFRQKPALTDTQTIAFPLYTQDASIVDRFGRRVKLAFVNWSGAHMCRHCVDGLQFRKLADICNEIKNTFGFNGVRLTFSLQMYYDNPIIPEKYIAANPELKGKRAMDIFDIVVNALTRVGLMVVLNNHVSSSMWCCSETDGQGLWWTQQYPQYKWIDALRHFSQRYAHNPRVVGFDLRNQIRNTPNYSATWGDGNVLTDWKKAAVEGANEVLKNNPNLLIFVSGLNYSLDLTDIKKSPIGDLIVPNKLIYTGHFYGFSWIVISWKLWTYEQFKQKMFKDMTFVRAMGVPFWLGQFGSNTADIPWNYLIRYLKQSDIDWAYWVLDGFKCEPNDDQTYGIYTNNFSQARHPQLLKDLQSIMKSNTPSQQLNQH